MHTYLIHRACQYLAPILRNRIFVSLISCSLFIRSLVIFETNAKLPCDSAWSEITCSPVNWLFIGTILKRPLSLVLWISLISYRNRCTRNLKITRQYGYESFTHMFDFVLSLSHSGREAAPVWIGLLTSEKQLLNVLKKSNQVLSSFGVPFFHTKWRDFD